MKVVKPSTTGWEARLAKKMTQQSLATAINEKVPEKGRRKGGLNMGVSINGGSPIVGWFIMENPT